jgi:hypothetical protein
VIVTPSSKSTPQVVDLASAWLAATSGCRRRLPATVLEAALAYLQDRGDLEAQVDKDSEQHSLLQGTT